MRTIPIATSLACAFLLVACGSQSPSTQALDADGNTVSDGSVASSSAAAPAAGDPEQALREGLASTLSNVAANAAGEVRQIQGPLFDDFELGIAHAVVMDNHMGTGPGGMRILDLELLDSAPEGAVARLRERLEAAGFRLNSSESNGARRDWDYRRTENERNLQGVLVKLSERPLRDDRAPQHAGATARLGLTLSDSRQAGSQ